MCHQRVEGITNDALAVAAHNGTYVRLGRHQMIRARWTLWTLWTFLESLKER